ncbi:TRAP transporter small permease [Acuticoccus sediminis]|uniref:TRAP transporter small permease n=1 Tax=Acuticoccus sediminis TaxID=2184697 RepID=UPI001CFD3699|nr:TRAP transporter small permease [Acuticoccus sediminis]
MALGSRNDQHDRVLAPEPSDAMRLAEGADRVLRTLDTAAMAVSALSIVAMTALVSLEVILRATLGASTLIASEFAGYLLVSTVYLGLAWTFRCGGFIRVEVVHGALKGTLLRLVNVVIAAIATATLLVYSYYLVRFVSQNMATGVTSIYVSRTPLWIPQLAMPLGAGLLTLTMAAHTVRSAALLLGFAAADDKAAHFAAEQAAGPL